MKIRGKLVFRGEKAGEMADIIARSLAPDNLSEIKTVIEDNSVGVTFTSDKIGTILSSVDDYLMNAIIVQKLSYILKESEKKMDKTIKYQDSKYKHL